MNNLHPKKEKDRDVKKIGKRHTEILLTSLKDND